MKINRAVWRIMPMILRYYSINKMCEKYGCTIFVFPHRSRAHEVDVWYKMDGGMWGCVGSVNPRDYWENIENTVISYSVIGMFQ